MTDQTSLLSIPVLELRENENGTSKETERRTHSRWGTGEVGLLTESGGSRDPEGTEDQSMRCEFHDHCLVEG